jgi:RNA polymerase sigma-70 factor (ECF subfamily)
MFTNSALVAETAKLTKFAFRLTRNRSDAEDLVQSTCLRALEKKDYFETGSNLFGWTSKIMYNLFVTNYRRKVKFDTQYDPEPFLNMQAVAPEQDMIAELAQVKRAMMQLSPEHHQILVMVGAQGMRYEEASKALGLPVGTVRSRLSRAREQLQAIMDQPRPLAPGKAISRRQYAPINMPAMPAHIADQALTASGPSAMSMR